MEGGARGQTSREDWREVECGARGQTSHEGWREVEGGARSQTSIASLGGQAC